MKKFRVDDKGDQWFLELPFDKPEMKDGQKIKALLSTLSIHEKI